MPGRALFRPTTFPRNALICAISHGATLGGTS